MDFPVTESAVIKTIGVSEATSLMTTIDDAGVAHTKGDWTSISDASPIPCDAMILTVNWTGVSSPSLLFDIGVGAAASEQTIVSNFLFGDTIASAVFSTTISLYLPIGIPANSRIALRYQGNGTTHVVRAASMLLKHGLTTSNPITSSTTYGANTADSGGTEIDAGATTNAKGAWTQIAASTTKDIRAILIGNRYPAATTGTVNLFLELGTGDSPNQVSVFHHYIIRHHDSFRTAMPSTYLCAYPIPVNIPAGKTLWGRLQSNNNGASQRVQDITVTAFH